MAEDVVEDPNQRYVRAYDSEEGIEVAWNQVRLHGVQPQQKAKILGEITILEQLKHPHIMEIYNSWETKDGQYVVFITEIMSMTLKDFVKKAKKVRLRNVKKWSLQILEALHYLHCHEPLVIHRDLKCDNLFMNANKGEIKIGDLGLSICMKDKKFAVSVIGTPEFMAPELYEGMYDEKVDIYAFGMCFLEMVTGDYPYSECQNAAQVYRKVTQGLKPDGIKLIQNDTIKDFIYLCLSNRDVRPSALELMQHKLFSDDSLDDLLFHLSSESDTQERMTFLTDHESLKQNPNDLIPDENDSNDMDATQRQITSDDEASANPFSDDPNESVTRVVLVENSFENNQVSLKLYLKVGNGYKEVKFPFHLGTDTPAAVAKEMVVALNLSDLHYNMIATGIADTLSESNLVPYSQITTISQAIEGDNGHVILSQTTVDPSKNVHPTSPQMTADLPPASNLHPIDELLATETHPTDTKVDPQANNTIILEMLDDPQLQQPLTTTPNTTTTITVVPQPNPTNPNSILERLVDQMKNGVSSSSTSSSTSSKKDEQQKSPPLSPHSVGSSGKQESSEDDSTTDDRQKNQGSSIALNIPPKNTKPPLPTSQQKVTNAANEEAMKLWQQLLKQQRIEEQMLHEKHKSQREELLKRYPVLAVSSPDTLPNAQRPPVQNSVQRPQQQQQPVQTQQQQQSMHLPQKSQFQNKSTGQIDISVGTSQPAQKDSGDDLTSLISKNLNLLSKSSSMTFDVSVPQKSQQTTSNTISPPPQSSGRTSPTIFSGMNSKLPMTSQQGVGPMALGTSGSMSQPPKAQTLVSNVDQKSTLNGGLNLKDTPVS